MKDLLCFLWSNIKKEQWYKDYVGDPVQFEKNLGRFGDIVFQDSIELCLGYLRAKGEDDFLENLDKWGFNEWMKDFDKKVHFEYVEGNGIWIDPRVRISVEEIKQDA